jgi:hypothetical protein
MEANFGNDPAKPFAYNIEECPGMGFDWNWNDPAKPFAYNIEECPGMGYDWNWNEELKILLLTYLHWCAKVLHQGARKNGQILVIF